MAPRDTHEPVRLALPKGRMEEAVLALLAAAGVRLTAGTRSYRPAISLAGFEAKVLKPQNIVEMLHAGSRDVGFAGADWVCELDGRLELLLDTGLDPVRLVAAAPAALLLDGRLPARDLVIATEYERLAQAWIARCGLTATLVRSYGATEVFPPEDADCIIDVTASGETLRSNNLVVVDELMRSTTQLYASPEAMADPARREPIERFVMLLRSVLEARRRVMLEVNVSREWMDAVLAILPCMREPTIAPLHGDAGFAVKAAVPREDLPCLIPEIKRRGGTDIVITTLTQIVP